MSCWTIDTLLDRKHIADSLKRQGLSSGAVSSKAKMFGDCAHTLLRFGLEGDCATTAFFVPGRIEVLGKHTDYAGGRSIVAAVERGFCVVVAPRKDRVVRVFDAVSNEYVEFEMHPELVPIAGHWSNYPMTVARRIARNFPGDLRGADITLASDLPAASGLSSSSAMIISSFLALSAVNDLPTSDAYERNIDTREDLAGYLGTIENGQSFGDLVGDVGVGTFGGSEDHTAILCAQPGVLSQYSYCPVRFQRGIRLADDVSFVIAFSGVAAEKTGEAQDLYNRVSQLAAAAMALWQQETGRADSHFASALQLSPEATTRFVEILRNSDHPHFKPQELVDRFQQFYQESEQIIPAVADEITSDTHQAFGELVERSQQVGAELLKNQVPETIFLANAARQLGAVAASAFGAGFGGSVWALVRTEQVSEFTSQWSKTYSDEFPSAAKSAKFFTTRPSPGAFELS